MMTRPFLDDWIAHCCGLDVLSEGSLLRYQLHKINEVLRYAERNSLLYRKRLAGVLRATERRSGRGHGLLRLMTWHSCRLRRRGILRMAGSGLSAFRWMPLPGW